MYDAYQYYVYISAILSCISLCYILKTWYDNSTPEDTDCTCNGSSCLT